MGFRDFIASLLGKNGPRARKKPAAAVPAENAAPPEPAPTAATDDAFRDRPAAPAPPAEQSAPAQPAETVATTPSATLAPAPVGSAPPSGGDDFDSVLDAAFAGENVPAPDAPTAQLPQDPDQAATAELFGEIAELQSRPVRSFIFELRRGTADKELIEICRPIMGSLIEAAESIGLPAAVESMTAFDAALETTQAAEDAAITEHHRERILACYHELEGLLGEEALRRDTVIIHSLLRQIPNVGHVTFERLYGAGVTSLDSLVGATPDDLFNTTGIPLWLSEQICGKLQEYRRQSETSSSDAGAADLRRNLIERVEEFRRHHDNLRRAEELPTIAERENLRRESRKQRETCALQINVLLAEMGQLDLADEIKKLGFERKIARLDEFIESTRETRPATTQGPQTDLQPATAE